jgi:hypothetical protein
MKKNNFQMFFKINTKIVTEMCPLTDSNLCCDYKQMS